MIANMDENGVITLQAETSVEAYALRQWAGQALVMQEDVKRLEQCHWRGSKLIVIGEVATKEA